MSAIVSYLLRQKGTNLMEGANKPDHSTWWVSDKGNKKGKKKIKNSASTWLEDRCSFSSTPIVEPLPTEL